MKSTMGLLTLAITGRMSKLALRRLQTAKHAASDPARFAPLSLSFDCARFRCLTVLQQPLYPEASRP